MRAPQLWMSTSAILNTEPQVYGRWSGAARAGGRAVAAALAAGAAALALLQLLG